MFEKEENLKTFKRKLIHTKKQKFQQHSRLL